MTQHILPNDQYNHIQDVACGCNPIVTIVEGEEICYHNKKDLNIEWLKEEFNKATKRIVEKYYGI